MRELFTIEGKHSAVVRGMGVFWLPEDGRGKTPRGSELTAAIPPEKRHDRGKKEEQKKELSKSAATGRAVGEALKGMSVFLAGVSQDSSPLFVQVGRDLQKVYQGTKAVTEHVRRFAEQLNGENEANGSLVGMRHLTGDVAQSLQKDQKGIEYNLQLAGRLLAHLTQVRQVYELIDKISSSFRVIRINIQIQCSANAISDELFQGLADDITSLSQRLDRNAKEIARELLASERNMTMLNKSVAGNLLKINEIAGQAEQSIANAFIEIERLVQGAALIVKEAGETSREMSRTVGEVVVSLQFHDSMSQQLGVIGQGIDQVRQFLSDGDEHDEALSAGHLETAHLVLNEQQRKIDGLLAEISTVRANIHCSFEVLEEKVRKLESMVVLLRMNGTEKQNFETQSSSLQKDFERLFALFSQGKKIKGEIHTATAITRGIADQLILYSGEMKDINTDTKLQAVNTIIMAGSLGEKGRTIEVLAKEISSLSDKTSQLTGEITDMQDAILDLVEKFADSSPQREGGKGCVTDLQQELEQFGCLYTAIDEHMADVSKQIEQTCGQMHLMRTRLDFLDTLEKELGVFARLLEQEMVRLEPWKAEEFQGDGSIKRLEDQRGTAEEEKTGPEGRWENGSTDEVGNIEFF